jgi:hypothetical protein
MFLNMLLDGRDAAGASHSLDAEKALFQVGRVGRRRHGAAVQNLLGLSATDLALEWSGLFKLAAAAGREWFVNTSLRKTGNEKITFVQCLVRAVVIGPANR